MQIPKITLDDLFSTQEQRDNANLEKVVDISIKDIKDFPNHPFKVIDNEEMEQMRDSIKENGVLVPVLVRPKENGTYEMISGHRRKRASELAEKETIPCIVRDLTDDEATIIMVDSNMQREEILPSEKAFAYKMKIEAMSRQGMRTDLTFSQVGKKLNAYEELANENGESRNQIHRYIRLTELVPELLEMVDKKRIAFLPAVEISYLTKEQQLFLLDCIEYNDATPSHAQAIKLKKMSQAGTLTEDDIDDILSQEKPNQIPKMKFDEGRIRSVLPKNIEEPKIEDFVVKAIEHYSKYLRQRDMSAR
ncbi:MAG: ParB/RepB/Spo0J family partition protein [Clostridia bacterium]|nr:ParB/RepB/Spo0J family partition protein [Clostridia bacterium]